MTCKKRALTIIVAERAAVVKSKEIVPYDGTRFILLFYDNARFCKLTFRSNSEPWQMSIFGLHNHPDS
jgi:hypothetical protein